MTYADYLSKLTRDLPGELWVWVIKATRDLGRIGTVRVAEDIGSHYRKAIAGSETEDEEAAAKRKMLESLGDPEKARRRFRKTHLTVAQENSIRRSSLLSISVRSRIYISAASIFLLGMFFTYFESAFAELNSITGFRGRFATFTVFIVLTLVIDYFSHKSFYRREISASVVQGTTNLWMALPIVSLVQPSDIPGYPYFASTLLLVVAWMVLNHSLGMMKIARKLPREISETDMRLLFIDSELSR